MDLFRATELPAFLHIDFLARESANAFSLGAARELQRLVRAHKKWTKPVVVTSAHDRVFCSGGNLSDYAKLKGKAPGLKVNREITAILDAFGAWPAPKLAVVQGDVLGGGMEWLARFDFRWSTPAAVFAFWQRRIGLTTGWGGGRAWAARIGETKVRELLLEARVLSADEALRRGLVDRVVPAWRARELAVEWAVRLEGLPAADAVRWSVASERKLLAELWMDEAHRAILQRWR